MPSSPAKTSPILRLLDFVDEIVNNGDKARDNVFVLFCYAIYGCFSMVVWRHFSDKDFSFICTLAGLTQMLAFFLLLHKMKVTGSAAGISSKTLQMLVLAYCLRLTSTMVKNGYLPVDRSGDWIYQGADVASLMLVFQLLYCCHKRYGASYQAEFDTFPIWKLLPACVLLGICFRGNLNHHAFYDSAWTVGLWCDTVAMLPQLWMLVVQGGEVAALTSNYVALTFLSRCMTTYFWALGYEEMAPRDGGMNVVGTVVMLAHSVQLLLSADFMYHYFTWQSSRCKARFGCAPLKPTAGLVLPEMPEMEFNFELDI